MKKILFVLVTAMSMNAMALEITTSVKITQANQADTAYKQLIFDAQPDAGIFVASGGKDLRPQLAKTLEVVRHVNRTNATDLELAIAILEYK
jgi:uncharacterized protein (TIGR02448 family)